MTVSRQIYSDTGCRSTRTVGRPTKTATTDHNAWSSKAAARDARPTSPARSNRPTRLCPALSPPGCTVGERLAECGFWVIRPRHHASGPDSVRRAIIKVAHRNSIDTALIETLQGENIQSGLVSSPAAPRIDTPFISQTAFPPVAALLQRMSALPSPLRSVVPAIE